MVDKIDKPDPKLPMYAVQSSSETKKDKQHEEHHQENLPTFQQGESSLFQQKFQGEVANLKTLNIPMTHIHSLKFRRATPRHGVPTAEADLIWKDGRSTEAVSFILKNWQDFMSIKNLKTGSVIDPSYWNQGQENLEVTIRTFATSGSWNVKKIQEMQQPKINPPLQKKSKHPFFDKEWIAWSIGAALGLLLLWWVL